MKSLFFLPWGYRHYIEYKKLSLRLEVPIKVLFVLKLKFWICFWLADWVFVEFPIRWMSALHSYVSPYTSIVWDFVFTKGLNPIFFLSVSNALSALVFLFGICTSLFNYLIVNVPVCANMYSFYLHGLIMVCARFFFYFSFYDYFSELNLDFFIFMYWNLKSRVTIMAFFY